VETERRPEAGFVVAAAFRPWPGWRGARPPPISKGYIAVCGANFKQRQAFSGW